MYTFGSPNICMGRISWPLFWFDIHLNTARQKNDADQIGYQVFFIKTETRKKYTPISKKQIQNQSHREKIMRDVHVPFIRY